MGVAFVPPPRAGALCMAPLSVTNENLAPIPENDAQFLQVVIGQVWEDGRIKAVRREKLGVFGHSNRPQPLPDCHTRCLRDQTEVT
jgi:hypothetical protein